MAIGLSFIRPIVLLAGFGFAAAPALAHEYWIEPLQYRIASGDDIRARLKVGQNFAGDNLPFLPDRMEEAGITNGAGTVPLAGMIGDLPAISETAGPAGLHVLHYYSRPTTLTHTDFARFEKFVRDAGDGHTLELHQARGLPQTGFIEAYTRCAKTLVQVGAEGGSDVLTGIPLELLAEANPYALKPGGPELPVRLFWLGEPLADTQIAIFRKGDEPEIAKVRTNGDGRAMISIGDGETFLLNAVRIIPRDDETSIVWHSYWASMTFRIGE